MGALLRQQRGRISWTTLGESEELGVLRYGDEAPAGASQARVEYEGREFRVPVRLGYFLFVAWDTDFQEGPKADRIRAVAALKVHARGEGTVPSPRPPTG
jgi:hypothetical protein